MVAWMIAALALAPSSPPQVLIVGGGPDPRHNQVGIERNVAYVAGLVPRGVPRTLLFADGGAGASVISEQAYDQQSPATRALRTLFGPGPDHETELVPWLSLRPTHLNRKAIQGPATALRVSETFVGLRAEAKRPLLLYGAGHGVPGGQNYDNNALELWDDGSLTVQGLGAHLSLLAPQRPVTVVLVQCFSGGFGKLLDDGRLAGRPVCGFFASPPDRTSAGCSASTLSASHDDFTGPFFAALTGKDRNGKRIPQPDYNGDGTIGGDEAFAYALIADNSVDVPTCTSDYLLRTLVPVESDDEVVRADYATIRKGASPAQGAALDALCEQLGSEALGDDRLVKALATYRSVQRRGENAGNRPPSNEVIIAVDRERRRLLARFPDLQSNKADDFFPAWRRAAGYLEGNSADRDKLAEVATLLEKAWAESEAAAVREARWMRLIRLAKSVFLEQKLRAQGNPEAIGRLEALRALEARNPLTGAIPPAPKP